jgi:hypothetical protein
VCAKSYSYSAWLRLGVIVLHQAVPYLWSVSCLTADTLPPQVAREIKLHINLNHASIIAMYAAWKDKQYVYLALEWAPGVRSTPAQVICQLRHC